MCDYVSESVHESGRCPARRGWENLSTRLETNTEPARPAKAESIVLALRDELRKRNDFEQQGETLKAHRANERAGRKMVTLATMMKYRFGLLAEATFGRDNPHLVEEAVEDIVGQLYEDLQDLGSSSRAQYYEVAFARRASLTAHDVIRRVKKRYGMRANKKDRARDHVPMSIQALEEQAKKGNTSPLGLVDAETWTATERRFGKNWIRDVLANLPDQKHKKVLILHTIKKCTFNEVADKVGISEKTARRYHERAIEVARQTVRGRD